MYNNIKVNVVGPMKSGKSQVVRIIEEATAGMGIVVTEQNVPTETHATKTEKPTEVAPQTGGVSSPVPCSASSAERPEQDGQGFLGGGCGGALIRRTSPVDPLPICGRTIGRCGGGEDDLSLGMRERVWKLLCRTEFNVSYWRLMEGRLQKFDVAIRLALGFGAMAGFIGIASDPSLLKVSAIISLVCAMISAIVMPAVGWDSLIGRVAGVRHRWVDAARMAHVMWEDIEADEKVTTKSTESLEAMLSDINKESFWFGDSKKFRLLAERESNLELIGE